MFFRYKRSSNYLKQNLFHSRMIRTVVGGGGPTCLKQTRRRVVGDRFKVRHE